MIPTILVLSIITFLLVAWSLFRNYSMLNDLHDAILFKTTSLGENINAQETKLKGSYTMSEALCRRVSILSQDIDGQTKLLSAMAATFIPQDKMESFFNNIDEYEKILKEHLNNTQSPPPPTADESSTQPQGSTDS